MSFNHNLLTSVGKEALFPLQKGSSNSRVDPLTFIAGDDGKSTTSHHIIRNG